MVEKAEHVKSAAVFNNAEGETKAAELLASAFAEAGEVLVELRRIKTAKGVATNLSISRNVVYLPQVQQTLLALLVSVSATQGSPSGVTLWCPLLVPSSVIGSTLTRIVRGPGSVPGWGLSNVVAAVGYEPTLPLTMKSLSMSPHHQKTYKI